jgi:hypothetical protein
VNAQIHGARARLLENQLAGKVGVWKILGEDPNCDLGGSHHQPTLATVQGTYGDAVEYALELSGFFSWGGGGDIVEVNILKVDRAALQQRAILSSRRTTLKAELAEVESELKALGGK